AGVRRAHLEAVTGPLVVRREGRQAGARGAAVPRRLRLALPLLLAAACAPPPPPPPAPAPARLEAAAVLLPSPPQAVGMHPGLPARLDSIVDLALREGAASGAAVVVGRHGRLVHQKGYGRTHSGPDAAAVTDSTLFDLASLTKVGATTTAAMILEESGPRVRDLPRADYLPARAGPAMLTITW